MSIALTIIHVSVCLILISVILLQAGRGQGLTGSSFGGGNVQSLFGTRAADFLTKATSVTAICFLFTSLGLDFVEVQKSRSLMEVKRTVQTIDVDAIRKALEAVKKQEAGAPGEELAGETAAGLEDAVPEESLGEVAEEVSWDAVSETPENTDTT